MGARMRVLVAVLSGLVLTGGSEAEAGKHRRKGSRQAAAKRATSERERPKRHAQPRREEKRLAIREHAASEDEDVDVAEDDADPIDRPAEPERPRRRELDEDDVRPRTPRDRLPTISQ